MWGGAELRELNSRHGRFRVARAEMETGGECRSAAMYASGVGLSGARGASSGRLHNSHHYH